MNLNEKKVNRVHKIQRYFVLFPTMVLFLYGLPHQYSLKKLSYFLTWITHFIWWFLVFVLHSLGLHEYLDYVFVLTLGRVPVHLIVTPERLE